MQKLKKLRSKKLDTNRGVKLRVNVLGTEYEIIIATKNDYPILEQADGFIDSSTKQIIIEEMKPDEYTKQDMDYYRNQVLRHEIIHAFLFESGLDSSSEWARNEEIVDWIAIQFPKISDVFEKIEV